MAAVIRRPGIDTWSVCNANIVSCVAWSIPASTSRVRSARHGLAASKPIFRLTYFGSGPVSWSSNSRDSLFVCSHPRSGLKLTGSLFMS
jgi:hypothetical protein